MLSYDTWQWMCGLEEMWHLAQQSSCHLHRGACIHHSNFVCYIPHVVLHRKSMMKAGLFICSCRVSCLQAHISSLLSQYMLSAAWRYWATLSPTPVISKVHRQFVLCSLLSKEINGKQVVGLACPSLRETKTSRLFFCCWQKMFLGTLKCISWCHMGY